LAAPAATAAKAFLRGYKWFAPATPEMILKALESKKSEG
jgi:hypothetical protein